MDSLETSTQRAPAAASPCRATGPRACIVSPLPNVRLQAGGSVAEMAHHQPLTPLGAGGLAGSATVRLRGDKLHVLVAADADVRIDLRRCPAPAADQLLLVVTACRGPSSPAPGSASFDLALRSSFGALADANVGQLPAFLLEELGHASVQGLSTHGWAATPPPLAQPLVAGPELLAAAHTVADRAYFRRRMKDEIAAALIAPAAGVASRHVQIATLIARRLQGARAPDPHAG